MKHETVEAIVSQMFRFGGVEGQHEAAVRDALELVGEPDAWAVFAREGRDDMIVEVYVVSGQTLHQVRASAQPSPGSNSPSTREWVTWRITPEAHYSVRIERAPSPAGWLTTRSWTFELGGGPVIFEITSQHAAAHHEFIKDLVAAVDRAA
jgi:hypothetical protein